MGKRFVSDTQKECSFCGNIKDHDSFHKDKTSPNGLAYYCKSCANQKARTYHNTKVKIDKQYTLKKKSVYLKYKYGLTFAEYQEKLLAQRFCAICGVELSTNDPNVHLDHCHKTGKIRAFLCSNCNRGIGCFHDNVEKLQKAIQYLESHKDTVES